MKRLYKLSTILLLALVLFSGCASKRKVLSSKSSKHVTVQQTNEGVYIVVHKEKSEDITKVQLIDAENGNGAIIDLSQETSVEFLWPFAETGKTYTVTANLTGLRTKLQESVTFKTDSVSTCVTQYNDAYLSTKLSLIASDVKRIVKLRTSKEALISVLGPTATLDAKIQIEVYSGKHFNTDERESTLVCTITKDIVNLADVQKLIDGYDIIGTASTLGISSADINNKLSAKPTYYARACVSYNLASTEAKNVIYTTKYIYSNDTVYTPIAVTDLPTYEDAK